MILLYVYGQEYESDCDIICLNTQMSALYKTDIN